MKRIVSFATALVLVLAGVTPLLAADAAAPTTVKGWITDSFCGAKNANKDGADCAKECYKKGAKLELVANGKTYQLSDQKSALAHVGYEVVVTGTIENDTIRVAKIEAAEVKKKA